MRVAIRVTTRVAIRVTISLSGLGFSASEKLKEAILLGTILSEPQESDIIMKTNGDNIESRRFITEVLKVQPKDPP